MPVDPTVPGAARTYRAWLSPDATPIPAPTEQTLLQSALAAGIEMLSSCRNGTCRACIRQLERGEVSYSIAWPGLSGEEKAQGYILPCVALPQSDLVLKAAT